MPSRKGPTRRSALTALIWAYNNGILDEVVPTFLPPSYRPGDRLEKLEGLRVEELEGILSEDSERLDFSDLLIEEVAAFLEEDPLLYDAYYLAESLDGHSRSRAQFLNADDGSIYLENFKYERALNGTFRPFIPIVNFLLDPQIYPFVNHFYFRYIVSKRLADERYRPISSLRDDLALDGHAVTKDFLTSYIRNHPDFLVVRFGNQEFAGIVSNVLSPWPFAAELIPDSEYLSIPGNAWRARIGYDDIRYDVEPSVLNRFFSFHRVKDVFDHTDPVEVALKLRFHRRRRQSTIQNIPIHTYNFIVSWIRENRTMWLTRRSRSILGYTFEFDPGEIPPGKLLVYGGGRRFLNRGETALVLNEMVSEGRQERGKIHSSRVVSGSTQHKFNPTGAQIDNLLKSDSCYEDHGVLDVKRVARKVLLLNKIPVSPYYEKRAIKAVERHASEFLEPVGKGMFVIEDLCADFEEKMPLAERRRCVLNSMFPHYGNLYDLLESVPQDLAQVIERLAH